MAKYCYNTFVVVDCKTRKNVLVTSSARKATAMLQKGRKIEVWNVNQKVEVIYSKTHREPFPMKCYIEAEKEYFGKKQRAAEHRNRLRAKKECL